MYDQNRHFGFDSILKPKLTMADTLGPIIQVAGWNQILKKKYRFNSNTKIGLGLGIETFRIVCFAYL